MIWGIIMNTALARRLALGDRVIWMGKDDCQPSGPGTIIRITAHQVEVLWEGETARRYRQKIQKISFDFFCPPPLLLPCPPPRQGCCFGLGLTLSGPLLDADAHPS
jgi:hypothetical protein